MPPAMAGERRAAKKAKYVFKMRRCMTRRFGWNLTRQVAARTCGQRLAHGPMLSGDMIGKTHL